MEDDGLININNNLSLQFEYISQQESGWEMKKRKEQKWRNVQIIFEPKL